MANDTLGNQIIRALPAGQLRELLTDALLGTFATGSAGAQAGIIPVCIPIPTLAAVATNAIVDVALGWPGQIIACECVVSWSPVTTGAKLATFTPIIGAVAGVGGTTTTGGVMATTSATMTPAGATVTGTAITALNTFTSAQRVGVKATGVTAYVEGQACVYLFCVRQ